MGEKRSSSPSPPALTATDLAQVEARGVGRAEAERQLALLASPPDAIRLDRPCSIDDGIRRHDAEHQAELEAKAAEAAAGGRVMKFVPASGAASRMFESLVGESDASAASRAELVAELDRFPFSKSLAEALRLSGTPLEQAMKDRDHARIVGSLLESPGLGYRSLPKALLEFHAYGAETRTAFEEHLVEAEPYLRDRHGVCCLHFTVSEEHQKQFATTLQALRGPLSDRLGATFAVGFSTQSSATDTLALDLEGQPFRLQDGSLFFRPGGHGALIRNLSQLEADVVVVKNIDNIVPDTGKEPVVRWKKILIGQLVETQERCFELLESLQQGGGDSVLAEAVRFAGEELGVAPRSREGLRDFLIDRLNRPLRVCGVVPNEDEPGGGPFWVRSAEGEISRQIVEASQTATDPAQQDIFRSGTHFNPVDLICGMRDRHGRPYDLSRFVDPDAVFIADKSKDGRELRALERPGLWNGAMARWNTVFVETPPETFAPVKTVFDLLRPAHQPPATRAAT